jgi:hypothetical protein
VDLVVEAAADRCVEPLVLRVLELGAPPHAASTAMTAAAAARFLIRATMRITCPP